jgi:hypothetical protein
MANKGGGVAVGGTFIMSGANLQTFLRVHNLVINNGQKCLLIQNSVKSNLF